MEILESVNHEEPDKARAIRDLEIYIAIVDRSR